MGRQGGLCSDGARGRQGGLCSDGAWGGRDSILRKELEQAHHKMALQIEEAEDGEGEIAGLRKKLASENRRVIGE